MTKVKRAYDASGRREQARARRLAVVLAARELFERDGFRPTAIAAVAAPVAPRLLRNSRRRTPDGGHISVLMRIPHCQPMQT